MKRIHLTFLIVATITLVSQGCSQDIVRPDLVDAAYGSHARNNFDIWKAASDQPTPLVVYIHGGGFTSGSKENISSKMVGELLRKGISVMAINYRLTPEVVFPQHYMDCVRAIQFARYHAKEWNIDPLRIAATGSSAGGTIALWIGFHDDLADSSSSDPILRMPTRLTCVATFSTPTSLEQGIALKLVGDLALGHSFYKGEFFGITPAEAKTPRGLALFAEASPTTHLTQDDPPVWAFYNGPTSPPRNTSEAVHNYNFGRYLKEKMDELGLESILLDNSHASSATKECVSFFLKQFGMQPRTTR